MTHGITMTRRRLDVLILCGAAITSGLMSVYFGQDGSWDLRNYHYYNAYAFLHGRLNFDIAPAQIQSFYNPILDVPFYWMMNWFQPIAYGFLVGGLHGLNIWLVYKIAYRLLGGISDTKRRLLSLASAVTGYFGAAGILEVGTSFHDNVTSLFVLAALFLVVADPELPSKKRVVWAGLLIGFATGLKLVVAIYALAFTLCLLVLDAPLRRKLGNVFTAVVSIGVGGLLSTGFWMIELWRDFANPLFPYYNKLFRSPYAVISNFVDDRFFPRTKYQVLFYPFYFLPNPELVSESSFRDIRFAVCYALFLLFGFMVYYNKVTPAAGGQGRSMVAGAPLGGAGRFVMVVFVLSYVIWERMFSIYRYLVPLELLAPVFILLIVRYIFPVERVLVRVTVCVFALIVITVVPIDGWKRRLPWSGSLVAVKVPAVQRIAHATVIVADDEPVSYIVPSFPGTTRFVSVRNNFMSPAGHTKLEDRARRVLDSCASGDLYLLYRGRGRPDYAVVLGNYNLAIQTSGRLRVVTRFDDDVYLIPVSRKTKCSSPEKDNRIWQLERSVPGVPHEHL